MMTKPFSEVNKQPDKAEEQPISVSSLADGDPKKKRVVKASVTKPKKKRERKSTKKNSDIPRRPLSAYNLFFRAQRTAILTERDEERQKEGYDESTEHRGQSLFCMMGKEIAKRWREIDDETRAEYKAEAEKDMSRYRKELDAHQQELARQTKEGADLDSKSDSTETQSDIYGNLASGASGIGAVAAQHHNVDTLRQAMHDQQILVHRQQQLQLARHQQQQQLLRLNQPHQLMLPVVVAQPNMLGQISMDGRIPAYGQQLLPTAQLQQQQLVQAGTAQLQQQQLLQASAAGLRDSSAAASVSGFGSGIASRGPPMILTNHNVGVSPFSQSMQQLSDQQLLLNQIRQQEQQFLAANGASSKSQSNPSQPPAEAGPR